MIIKEKEKKDRYFEDLGGRKTAHARVRVYEKAGTILVNGKDYKQYFRMPKHQLVVEAPFELLKIADQMSASVMVKGGGINGQADAVRNGIAKALSVFNPEFKKKLRRAGFVTRDPRVVERKKYGLKKARRAPQWQKR